ncbi:hypothetical protein B0H63DRAFT_520724 [Podospora didyma]|uniref:Uncharacterized protein n=1 Tax=Podospora didyma TaxID=330526 RepID=A0AAE0U0S5_9PEZI|nr:hypothetical protein B0H63DRAFT_520724 [Podospora didyma]
MKPMEFYHLSGLGLQKDTLFLFNTKFTELNRLRKFFDRVGYYHITSQGGIRLPREVWNLVFDKLSDEAKQDPEFCFVKASVISALCTDTKIFIRLTRHDFALKIAAAFLKGRSSLPRGRRLLASNLFNPASVAEFERFLSNATPKEADDINRASREILNSLGMTIPTTRLLNPLALEIQGKHTNDSCAIIPALTKLSGRENVFTISYKKDMPRGLETGLYFDVFACDVIARIDGGSCWVCASHRFFCASPKCVCVDERYGGAAKTMFGFEQVAVRCGNNTTGRGKFVACPLCLGPDLTRQHIYHLRNLGIGQEGTEKMDEMIRVRKRELGYDSDSDSDSDEESEDVDEGGSDDGSDGVSEDGSDDGSEEDADDDAEDESEGGAEDDSDGSDPDEGSDWDPNEHPDPDSDLDDESRSRGKRRRRY